MIMAVFQLACSLCLLIEIYPLPGKYKRHRIYSRRVTQAWFIKNHVQ